MTDTEALDAEVVPDNAQDEVQTRSGEQIAGPLAAPTDILPVNLHLLPLSERPFFPAQALPILLNEEPWLPTVDAAARTDQQLVGLILVKPDRPDQAGPDDFYPVGTIARMHQLARGDGRIQFIAQ